jgi:hypothetical protein
MFTAEDRKWSLFMITNWVKCIAVFLEVEGRSMPL